MKQTNNFTLAGTVLYRKNIDRYYIKYRGIHLDSLGTPSLVHNMLLRIEAAPSSPSALSYPFDLTPVLLHGYLGPSGILYVESVEPCKEPL